MHRAILKPYTVYSRSVSDPVLWTNGLFLVNSIIWLHVGSLAACLATTWAAVTSIFYHKTMERNPLAHLLDRTAAVAALLITVGVSAQVLTVLEWMMVSAFLLLGLALKSHAHKKGEIYDGWHTAWHVCVFAGQAILALAHV